MKGRLLILGAILGGCGPATEVVVSVDGELMVPTEIQRLRITVSNPPATDIVYQSQDLPLCGAGQSGACFAFPISVTLVPGKSSSPSVRVEVDAFADSTTPVTSDASIFSFAPGQSQRLQFFLYRNCLHKQCALMNDQACDANGNCFTLGPGGGSPDLSSPPLDGTSPPLDMTSLPPDLTPPPDLLPGPSLCGPAGTASKCPGTFAQCANFEGSFDWAQTTINITNALDTTRFCRGSSSLQVHSSMPGTSNCSGGVYENSTYAASQPHVWVRGFVYQPAPLASTSAVHLFLGQSVATAGVGAKDGQLAVFYAGTLTTSATAFPPDRWNCLEMEMDPAGHVNVWFDDLAVTDLSLSQPYSSLNFIGVGLYSFAAPVDVWVDEVAVSTGRIGCTN
jgi:hypothetical protein